MNIKVERVLRQIKAVRTARSIVFSKASLQGPPGVTPTYEHTQSSPSATWTINHNLGFKPAVQLFTAGGVEFEGDVTHPSVNQCIVYLSTATAGSARLT